MIRLLQFLIYGHFHKWKILEKSGVFEEGLDKPTYVDYACQCERCGEIKRFRT